MHWKECPKNITLRSQKNQYQEYVRYDSTYINFYNA